ncbi:MAG TPA: translation initiation factor [Fimbriiglobus sp.]|jgi:predicted translation initiation factor SUI1
MAEQTRTVVFLCSPEDTRGSMAVAAFHAAVKRMGLSWSAVSRELAATTPFDVAGVNRIVSFGPAPGIPGALVWGGGDVEEQVMGLIATMLGGKADGPANAPKSPPPQAKKTLTAKVGRETAGRRGKGVTIIFEVSVSEQELMALGAALKNACGTGGTVKDGRIEIQGDQRDRVTVELEKRGFKVKRSGG